MDESKDIWANIKFAKDEGAEDEDNASETDDEATKDNIDNGLTRKPRPFNSKADDEIMLFEKEVDHITSLNPNKRR